MLQRLLIKNLVTIEKAVFEPGEGFSVLTGETGAGKSVVLKAIALLMGVKGSRSLIRTGEESLMIEGVFDLSSHPETVEQLTEQGIVTDENLIIRRQIQKDGANRVFINDQIGSNQVLGRYVGKLIDMHSQHAQQALSSHSSHVHFLDQYAGLNDLVKTYSTLYQDWLDTKRKLEEGSRDIEERNRRIDFIEFQIREIEEAGFSVEEEEELLMEQKKLFHREKLSSLLAPFFDWELNDNDPLSRISSALSDLGEAVELDGSLKAGYDFIDSAIISLDEGIREVQNYRNELEFSEEHIENVNERLSELDRLKRKYGASVSEINAFLSKSLEELRSLKSFEQNLDKLKSVLREQEHELWSQAEMISRIRNKKSVELEGNVKKTLQYLGLEKSDFMIELVQQDCLSAYGIDKTVFLFTANPGHPLQPLSQIASGGELSRVMLALKVSAREKHQTMIFDEIDSGVSGSVAAHVGEKLAEISEESQVICITHSPQVASLAADHWKVSKRNEGNATYTEMHLLKKDERIAEIAQIISGNATSEQACQMAEEMLNKTV